MNSKKNLNEEGLISSDRAVLRNRIVKAAAGLIRAQGTEAATTRAVAAAAAIQAPTIYRLVGDKDALLDAVAEYELAAYVAAKRNRKIHSDAVEELRLGWDRHVQFGLAHPELFQIMSGNAQSPAAQAGLRALTARIHAIALAGRLRGGEERAVSMVHAACVGTVLTLLSDAQATSKTYSELSTRMREAMIATITVTASADSAGGDAGHAATTLRARLKHSDRLTKGERALLDELLLRLSDESQNTSDVG